MRTADCHRTTAVGQHTDEDTAADRGNHGDRTQACCSKPKSSCNNVLSSSEMNSSSATEMSLNFLN